MQVCVIAQSVKARGELLRGRFCLFTCMRRCCSHFCCCTTSMSSQQLLCLLSCTALLGLRCELLPHLAFSWFQRCSLLRTTFLPTTPWRWPSQVLFYFDRVRVLLLSRLAFESQQFSCLSSSAKITGVPLSFTLFNLKIESRYILFPGPNHVAQGGLELKILSFS